MESSAILRCFFRIFHPTQYIKIFLFMPCGKVFKTSKTRNAFRFISIKSILALYPLGVELKSNFLQHFQKANLHFFVIAFLRVFLVGSARRIILSWSIRNNYSITLSIYSHAPGDIIADMISHIGSHVIYDISSDVSSYII